MQILVIRHAQSRNNAMPLEHRIADPGLTAIGEQQAKQLAASLADVGITRLVTSPFLRTLQTMAPLREATGLRPEVWAELHEQGGCFSGYTRSTYASQPGMKRSKIVRQFGEMDFEKGINERGWWRGKEFESLRAAAQRAKIVVRRARERFEDQDCVALVTHGTFLRLLLRAFLSVPQDDPPRLGQAHNAGWSLLDVGDDGTFLESWNVTSHLSSELRTVIGGVLERI